MRCFHCSILFKQSTPKSNQTYLFRCFFNIEIHNLINLSLTMGEACAYANVTFYNSDSFLFIAYLHVKNKMFTNRVHTHMLYVDTLSVCVFNDFIYCIQNTAFIPIEHKSFR